MVYIATPNFLVKPFCQRYDEQERSRKRAAQTLKDLLVKIAEISKEFLPVEAKILLYRVKFLQVNPQNFALSKILCAKSAKSAQAIKLPKFANFFLRLFLFGKEKVGYPPWRKAAKASFW